MAESTVNATLRVDQWDSNFFSEYVRANRFSPYMGTSMNDIIQVKEQLTKKQGDQIIFPLVTKLSGAGVTGSTQLDGNEEAITDFGHTLTVDTLRNGIRFNDLEQQRSAYEMRKAAKELLKNWAMEQLRDGVIDALGSIIDTTKYADATEANKDTHYVSNQARYLMGSSITYTGDHSAELGGIDSTNDLLTPANVSIMKRKAKDPASGPKIRPYKVNGDEEWYVLFAQPRCFRDLKENSTMLQANREARPRMMSNPIFTDGDLVWDGVIIREVPELPVDSGAGASSIDVAANYLCGAQAVAVGWAQRTKSVTQEFDYGYKHGLAVSEIRGVEAFRFNSLNHGYVTGWFSAVAD